MVVYTQAIALCVAIRKESSLQHLIGRKTYTVDDIHRVKRSLLGLSIEVFGVAVKLKYSHIVQREITMIPHLRKVKGVDVIFASLLFAHKLHLHLPAGILATLYCVKQISLM